MTADKKLWRNRKKGRNGSDDCDQRIQLRGGLSACSKVEVGNRRLASRHGRIEIRNRCAGLSVSRQTCIVQE